MGRGTHRRQLNTRGPSSVNPGPGGGVVDGNAGYRSSMKAMASWAIVTGSWNGPKWVMCS